MPFLEEAVDCPLSWEDSALVCDFLLFQECMVDGIESSSLAWGHSGWSNVKLSSRSKSKSREAVIGWTFELLIGSVGVAVDAMEHFVNALN